MSEIDRQLFELMVRAPAIPYWFEPIGELEGPTQEEIDEPGAYESMMRKGKYANRVFRWERERERRRQLDWPSFYAKSVLEAAAK